MNTIDFANSYMTWFPHDQGNIARIQLDAACTLIDEKSGKSEQYYLIAPCRAEPADAAASLHLYGKTTPRPGRKMGHITVTAATPDEARQRAMAIRTGLTAR